MGRFIFVLGDVLAGDVVLATSAASWPGAIALEEDVTELDRDEEANASAGSKLTASFLDLQWLQATRTPVRLFLDGCWSPFPPLPPLDSVWEWGSGGCKEAGKIG